MVGPLGNHGFAFRHIDGSLLTSYPASPVPESSDAESADTEFPERARPGEEKYGGDDSE